LIDEEERKTECRCVESIDLIALSSVNKSMMSSSYRVMIAMFNDHWSEYFLESLKRAAIVAHMVRGPAIDDPSCMGGGGGGEGLTG
jgi:hypothetical protein